MIPVLPVTAGGFPRQGGNSCPLHIKGGDAMIITLEQLLMLAMFVISLISLIRSEK